MRRQRRVGERRRPAGSGRRLRERRGGARLDGTVESIAAGIADRDRSTGTNLLPSVNPTFNWVRLAQRIPVRVRLAPLAAGTRLVAGETVTVEVVGEATAPKLARRPATAASATRS